MDQGSSVTAAALRAPRAAGIAGVLFALLLATALILIRLSVPSDPAEAGTWLTDPAKRDGVSFALNLIPFAGIAFLWFIGVVRDRIGQREDRLFATVFLGSGLLFVAMLFVAAATAGGLLANPTIASSGSVPDGSWTIWRDVTFTVLNTYAMRMAAVFILSTTTIALRVAVIPIWLGVAGFAVAVILLFGVGFTGWANLVMPAWVLLLSLHILVFSFRSTRPPSQEVAATT